MIIVGIAAIIAIIAAKWVLNRLAVERKAVNAGRARTITGPVQNQFLMTGFLRDEDGDWVDPTDKFIGWASGPSMEHCGIPNGATFVAERMSEAELEDIQSGDIVVVDAPTKYSQTGLRLRCVDKIADGKVQFFPHRDGGNHNHRPIEAIIARVTHVIDSDTVTSRDEASAPTRTAVVA